jgi:glycosyltransferase involved in cell wall biosynthesis
MAVYQPPLGMLDAAVGSILAQSHRDFEFLIIDDGSEQPELDNRLEQYARHDARVRVAREPHRGLTASLNRGLDLATGEWIARQDADDWSAPQRLERQLAFCNAHPDTGVLGCDAWTHQQDGTRLWRLRLPRTRPEILAAFPRTNPFVHGAVMFRRSAATAEAGYREVFRCSQDYDLFWRMAESYGAANLAAPLYHYRYTGGSISASRALEQMAAHLAIRRLAGIRGRGQVEDPPAALAWARARVEEGPGLYRALLKQADHRMLAGDGCGAARAYRELLATHPLNPLGWGKLLRLGVFQAAPFLREACFR